MNIKFKDLFRFEKKEIDHTFQNSTQKACISGIKLLQAKSANEDQYFGKLLIITSRKVGKAVKRNKIKRQLKEIFYQEKLYQKPINSILIVYKSALELSFKELKDFLMKNI